MPVSGKFTSLLPCFFFLFASAASFHVAASEPGIGVTVPEAANLVNKHPGEANNSEPGKANSGELRVYAVTLPPQSMETPENGGHGIIYDLTAEAFRRAGLPFAPEFLPLARAQHTVRNQPNSLLIYGTRLPERENLYTWVAPLVGAEYVVVRLGTPAPKIETLENAKSLGSIGVTHNTAQLAFLTANGFTNLEIVPDEKFNVEKLAAKRIDGWYTIKDRAAYLWRQLGHTEPISYSAQFQTQQTWLIGSLDISPELAGRIKAGVESVKADGTLQKIRAKYLGEQP